MKIYILVTLCISASSYAMETQQQQPKQIEVCRQHTHTRAVHAQAFSHLNIMQKTERAAALRQLQAYHQPMPSQTTVQLLNKKMQNWHLS